MMSAEYLAAMKTFEGYSPRARWDYAQHTNGFGTKAAYAGEVIDRAEAEKRFAAAVEQAADQVDRFSSKLDEGTKAALTSLTYNAGSAWMQSGLGQAIAAGDMDKARALFVQYNKAGGEKLEGLVQRRLSEVGWFGQGGAAQAKFVAAAAAALSPTPAIEAALASNSQMALAAAPAQSSVPASNASDSAAPVSPPATAKQEGPNINSEGIVLSLLALVSKSGSQLRSDGAAGQSGDSKVRIQAASV